MDYSVNELAAKLRELYDNTKKDKVAMIHLFGIRYGEIIRSNNVRVSDIVKIAKLNHYCVTELNKGINLAKFVNIKNGIEI